MSTPPHLDGGETALANILAACHHTKPVSTADVADEVSPARPDVSQSLRFAAEQGLLERVQVPSEGPLPTTAAQYRLTPDGERFIRRHQPPDGGSA